MTNVFLRETQKKKIEKVESLYDVYTYHIHIIYIIMFIRSNFGYLSGLSVRGGLDGWVGLPLRFFFAQKS